MPNDSVKSNVEVARAAWGEAAPEWVIVLAEACDRASQAKIARRLGYTGPVINQALRATYAGRMDKLEQKVRGELMREMVGCPVLGEISMKKCVDTQARAQARSYAPTNALRVELRRACRVCPYRLNKEAA